MIKQKIFRFDILTLFPQMLDGYFGTSILKRAQEKGVANIVSHQIRDYTTDKHHATDETPYGGGAGMVMKAEPILRAVQKVSKHATTKKRQKVIIMSAKGKPFTQKLAYEWAKKYDHVVIISGRYEGIDERVKTILKAEEISIGPYVLTDGDVGAMVVVSAVTRLLPGVIRFESLAEESHWDQLLKSEISNHESENLLEYPHYTRPEILQWKGKKYRVPKVLLSGNHKKIEDWRTGKRKTSTH